MKNDRYRNHDINNNIMMIIGQVSATALKLADSVWIGKIIGIMIRWWSLKIYDWSKYKAIYLTIAIAISAVIDISMAKALNMMMMIEKKHKSIYFIITLSLFWNLSVTANSKTITIIDTSIEFDRHQENLKSFHEHSYYKILTRNENLYFLF